MNFPAIILVQTKISGNIGAVARCMKNMGFAELVLVDPVASHLNREALDRAMEGRSLLDSAQICTTLASAVADCQRVVGTSGKLRNSPVPLITPRELSDKFRESTSQKWALVFGPEDTGLKNEELALCDTLISIPTSQEFTSLNLSHAVIIILYEIFMGGRCSPISEKNQSRTITTIQRETLFTHLQEAFLKIGFLDPKNPDRIMDDLRHIFNRAQLDEREASILRGIARQILNRCTL